MQRRAIWAILAAMSDEETATLPEVPAAIKEAARQAGGGWLDEVVGNHTPPVPLSAVRGAWKLNADGELTGEYVANPEFRQMRRGGCPFHRAS
jgi:hypothetical protein